MAFLLENRKGEGGEALGCSVLKKWEGLCGSDRNESNWYIKVIVGIWCVALGNISTSLLRGAVGVVGLRLNRDEYVQETFSLCRRSDGGERVKR